jgi:hypothetical protein
LPSGRDWRSPTNLKKETIPKGATHDPGQPLNQSAVCGPHGTSGTPAVGASPKRAGLCYGSSGKGGTLCIGLRKSFGLRKKEGSIKNFIAGEDFSIFNETTLDPLEAVPELRGEPDLGAANEGITMVWLM